MTEARDSLLGRDAARVYEGAGETTEPTRQPLLALIRRAQKEDLTP